MWDSDPHQSMCAWTSACMKYVAFNINFTFFSRNCHLMQFRLHKCVLIGNTFAMVQVVMTSEGREESSRTPALTWLWERRLFLMVHQLPVFVKFRSANCELVADSYCRTFSFFSSITAVLLAIAAMSLICLFVVAFNGICCVCASCRQWKSLRCLAGKHPKSEAFWKEVYTCWKFIIVMLWEHQCPLLVPLCQKKKSN